MIEWLKARELYREISRERMNTLGTDLPDYSLWSQDFKPDEMANLLKLLCENFEKDLGIWWNKIRNLKKEVRTPGNEAETWDSSPHSLGPVHLEQDSSSIWGCHTPTPINASTGCLWNQPLWIFSWHFFDLKEYRQQNIIAYLCLYLLFYYLFIIYYSPWTWTMFQNHSQKALGTSCCFWGEGQGFLMLFLSKTVAMLIKLVLFSKTCNRTFFVTCLISHWASKRWTPLARDLTFLEHWVLSEYSYFTAFAVHYDKIRNHLLEEATNSAKIHSLARKYQHLRIN